ncbi:hypothetical protein jhhlp_007328 [Lomentospora prolificans]|uniref:Uncharacterized protein n=1 Tax=Lomentospora prolificans TaxID=41688 RepID=A0A2N3N2C9_9PEZI|nr:hypothetical protein jhhlp_007328 [Lomentospora prolificans]
MATRAPGAEEAEDACDQARTYDGLSEPFLMTIRDKGRESVKDVKIIWWYIAEVTDIQSGEAESQNGPPKAKFFKCSEALSSLHYQGDRDVLERAISIVKESEPTRQWDT